MALVIFTPAALADIADALGDVRRALLKRFPYAVFFRIAEDGLQVLGCFHTSRDPRRWEARS